MNQNCWSWRGRGADLHILHLTHNYKLQKNICIYSCVYCIYSYIFHTTGFSFLMLSKSDAAETGFQEPLKSQSEGKIYLSSFLRRLTQTSLIKRRIVKDKKSEQVSSQMQMWILLQEIVTWSAARHKRNKEKREGEHLHFFSCRIMWVGGWVRQGVTDLDLLVFVFVFVILYVFLVIQNYVWESVEGSLIHLIKIGLDRWGAGDEKGEKFCVELLQPMIRQLLTIGVLE